jgi:hypothetical protein
MRRFLLFLFWVTLCVSVHGQTHRVDFTTYLRPRCDTMFYNCVYNSFHANELHETIALVYRTIKVGDETACYISRIEDTTGKWAWLSSFTNSAMIFNHDTIRLASLHDGENVSSLKLEDFWHILTPQSRLAMPLMLSNVKWAHFINSTCIGSFEFDNVSIGDTVLNNCLKLNLLEYDRGSEPCKSTVWLNKNFGIVKWIRCTGRTEALDVRRALKNCR